MSILDTFYVLFKGDTTDLKKSQQDAEKGQKALTESVKQTNSASMDLGVTFLSLAQQAASALGVVVGVGAAIKGGLKVEEQTLDLYRFSKALGTSYQEVQKWVYAGKMVGASSQEITGDIKALVLGMSQVGSVGGVAIQTPLTQLMQKLIATGYIATDSKGKVKDFGQALLSISDTLAGRNKQFDNNYIKSLGLSEGTLRLLQEGRINIEQFLKAGEKAGIATDEQGQKLEKTARDWADFTSKVENITRVLAGPFVSALDALINPTDDLSKGIQDLGIAMAVVGGVVALTFVPFAALGVAITGALAPILIVIAAVTALWAILHYGPEIAKSIGNAFGTMFHNLAKWGGEFLDMIKDIFGFITKAVTGTNNLKIGPKGEKTADGTSTSHEEVLTKAAMAIKQADSNPIAAQTNNSVITGAKTNNKSIKIDQINIQTQATDADGISKDIGAGLSKNLFSQTIMQFSDGISG